MVKRGDVVIISSGGKEHNALVHAFNPFHEGGPSVHVSVVADDPIDNNTRKPKLMPIGYIPESVMMHDVTEWKESELTVEAFQKLKENYWEELDRREAIIKGQQDTVVKLSVACDAAAQFKSGSQLVYVGDGADAGKPLAEQFAEIPAAKEPDVATQLQSAADSPEGDTNA